MRNHVADIRDMVVRRWRSVPDEQPEGICRKSERSIANNG